MQWTEFSGTRSSDRSGSEFVLPKMEDIDKFEKHLSDQYPTRHERKIARRKSNMEFMTRLLKEPSQILPWICGLHLRKYPDSELIPKYDPWDPKTHKVEACPELVKFREHLKSRGLNDPWMRNYVWRFHPANTTKQTTTWRFFGKMLIPGFFMAWACVELKKRAYPSAHH